MENIVKFKELDGSYKDNYIGSGDNGSVYRLDDNYVFKTFNNPKKFEETVKRLSKINSSVFVLPKDLVYDDDKFYGYIMDYVDGKTLDKIDNMSIYEYISNMKKVEYSLAALTLYKLYMFDFKDGNIMIDKDNNFKIIDTDFYRFSSDNNLYQNNISNFSNAILKPFLNIYNDYFYDNILNHNKELLIDGKYLPSKYLIDLINYLNKENILNNESINEVSNSVKLVLK